MQNSPLSTSDSIGQIIYVAGPTSSGKTTYCKDLAKQGWVHLEVDAIFRHSLLEEIKQQQPVAFNYLHRYLPESETLFDSIRLNLMPAHLELKEESAPKYWQAMGLAHSVYCKIWKSLEGDVRLAFCKEVFQDVVKRACQEAISGNNVVFDFTRLIFESPVTRVNCLELEGRHFAWTFVADPKVKVTQKIKYVPLETLMYYLFCRLKEMPKSRKAFETLRQYATHFKRCKEGQQEIGHLSLAALKEWIEIAVQLDYLSVDLSEANTLEEMKNAVRKAAENQILSLNEMTEVDSEVENASSSDYFIEPSTETEPCDLDLQEELRENLQYYEDLIRVKIDELTEMIFLSMKLYHSSEDLIPLTDPSEDLIPLTYHSNHKLKLEVI